MNLKKLSAVIFCFAALTQLCTAGKYYGKIINPAIVPIKALVIPPAKADGSRGAETEITDFLPFRYMKKPKMNTVVKISRDRDHLYINVICPEKSVTAPRGASLWSADHIEIFFGENIGPSWHRQLAFGANGTLYDSSGQNDQVDYKTVIADDHWRVDVKLPLKSFRMHAMSCNFNVCRYSQKQKHWENWSGVKAWFHELENYGRLLFADYRTVYHALTGKDELQVTDRSSFEKFYTENSVPTYKLSNGPFLTNPAPDAMSIIWRTMGPASATVNYRKAGSSVWQTKTVKKDYIVDSSRTLHVIHLNGLTPDTQYEYQVLNDDKLQAQSTFKTCAVEPHDYDVAISSDNHTNPAFFNSIFGAEPFKNIEFTAHLGDMINVFTSVESFFYSIIDNQVKMKADRRPLVFARGNHETVGKQAARYGDVVAHPSGKTFYAFRKGDVLFIVLDTGDAYDLPQDMCDEHYDFLKKLSATDSWKKAKFRVCLLHIPPKKKFRKLMREFYDMPPEKGGFHLMLCGHTHFYYRSMPGKCKVYSLPYPVIVNSNDTGILMKVRKNEVECLVYKPNGVLLDSVKFKK